MVYIRYIFVIYWINGRGFKGYKFKVESDLFFGEVFGVVSGSFCICIGVFMMIQIQEEGILFQGKVCCMLLMEYKV